MNNGSEDGWMVVEEKIWPGLNLTFRVELLLAWTKFLSVGKRSKLQEVEVVERLSIRCGFGEVGRGTESRLTHGINLTQQVTNGVQTI